MKVIEQTKSEWISNIQEFDLSYFLQAEWVELFNDTNKKAVYFDFIVNDEVIGKLSGFIVKGSVLKGNTFFSYAGPSFKNTEKFLNIGVDKFVSHIKKHNVSRVILSSYHQRHFNSITSTNFVKTCRDEFEINLDVELISSSYSKRFKGNLKKSRKVNYQVNFSSDPDDLKHFYSLLESTRNERVSKKRKDYNPFSLPHVNKLVINKLCEHKKAVFVKITVDDVVRCISILLIAHPYANMLMMGMDSFAYKNGLSSLLYDKSMCHLKEMGIKSLNVGGIPDGADGEKLAIFKKSMGAERQTVYGGTTDFIKWPYKLLNPLMTFGRALPQNNLVVRWIKQFV